MLSRLLTFLAALMIVAGPAPAAGSARGDLRLVDLTPAFTKAWEATATLPDAERAPAFRAEFAKTLPGFYAPERVGQTVGTYDARLLGRLKQFPERRAEMEGISARFDTMFAPALKTFEARFGPMRGYRPVYLVNSLGEFDGGTRELSGGVVLMFGADVIARIHADHDIQPFFHHELFHLYHQRRFTGCDAVWCNLWAEGLATYAAKTMNPKASDAELLLTVPEPLREAVERDRKDAVCAVVKRLDSTSEADNGALFSSGRLSPTLPPRFGYYVGYLAASEMGRARSLKLLAQMKSAEVRPEVERTLRRLADCP